MSDGGHRSRGHRYEQIPRFEGLSLTSLFFAELHEQLSQHFEARPPARNRGSKRQDEDGRPLRSLTWPGYSQNGFLMTLMYLCDSSIFATWSTVPIVLY